VVSKPGSTILFYFIRSHELASQLRAATDDWQRREEAYLSELAKLEKIRHIPGVIEKAKRLKTDAETRMAEATQRADEVLQRILNEAQAKSRDLREVADETIRRAQEESRVYCIKTKNEAEKIEAKANEILRIATTQAQHLTETAEKEAKELASKARKEAKTKREESETALNESITYALEIRRKAQRRAVEVAGEAYEAKGKLQDYKRAAEAFKNLIDKSNQSYKAPESHLLDDLADEYRFDRAADKLKLARERTRLMQKNGLAATCGYSEGWKKDHALKFVLSTFNGKVDTILARLKTGNQTKLIQEIKDAYALVNLDGEVYKKARIHEEYLDSRLDEIKWGAAVLRLKEKAREEQRAIKEQIREEQRAKKEIEKAIKLAEREEELVNKAIAKVKQQFKEASEAQKAQLEAQLQELGVKLAEAEEKGKKAVSMAQQTKRGHVYIISNVGSFGENIYKIGLTRRLDPTERVQELGGASVPFPFDIHAMLLSDDAPALETKLHRHFIEYQVNKVNRRKEFFNISLQKLKEVIIDYGVECRWTLEAEASQYRETLALEQAMRTDSTLRTKWLRDQSTFDFVDDELEESTLETQSAQV